MKINTIGLPRYANSGGGGMHIEDGGQYLRAADVEALGTEDGACIVSTAELVRLMRAAQMWDYVVENVTYLEDRCGCLATVPDRYWQHGDDCRLDASGEALPIEEYIAARVDGLEVWTATAKDEAAGLPIDDDALCGACNGSGEGACAEQICRVCHGSGEAMRRAA